MALHLIKLCVGAESIADLETWIASTRAAQDRAGRPREQAHTTRMVPKRAAELLDGGSLYWVIKGQVCARQRLLAVRPFTDSAGVGRCRLVLDPAVVAVAPQPRKAFQGWRYFEPKDAPADLKTGGGGDLPETLRRELATLGLI